MFEYTFNMAETLAIAVILLLLGKGIKKRVPILERFFIPAPVIGGTLFSIFMLIGHNTGTFTFNFDSILKDFLMVIFFTTIGFSASFELLKKGGVGVALFLAAATILVIIQDVVGVFLAKAFNLHPYIGLAAGSIPLTGGHGTSGAFGPVLEEAGAAGAFSVAIASATFGLVAGCLIGGPVAKRLLQKYNLKAKTTDEETGNSTIKLESDNLGPMVIAAIIRNIADAQKKTLPMKEISIIGSISLSLFLSMALMSMKLWELAALALPLIVILLIQTVIMALFAYHITFRIMGKDYDAAVLATGHCGFGLGATPNAMANMETFTSVNGFSAKAFFVLPLVGSLFIDFVNASIITFFMNIFK